jgi:hypothetical protein
MKKLIFLMMLLSPLSHAETYFEVGPTVLVWDGLEAEFSNGEAFLVTHKTKNNYEFGVILVTSQTTNQGGYYCNNCYVTIPQNYAVRAAKHFHFNRWDLGGGIAYWHDHSLIFPQKQTFEITVGYRATDRLNLRLRHYSNAWQKEPNIGLNIVTITYDF